MGIWPEEAQAPSEAQRTISIGDFPLVVGILAKRVEELEALVKEQGYTLDLGQKEVDELSRLRKILGRMGGV